MGTVNGRITGMTKKAYTYFIRGIGEAIRIFPSRAEAQSVPIPPYFYNAGVRLHNALEVEGPRIRRHASQMELPLERQRASR